jgi:hypothetical protein
MTDDKASGKLYVLVPLINSMIMDEHWLDLYSAEKEMVCDAVVKIK